MVGLLDRSGVPYMVTGSVASSYHGEPRATRDLDIVIDPDPEALARMVDELLAEGLSVDLGAAQDALRHRGQFNAIDSASGWKVDFIVRWDRAFSRVEFGRRVRAELLGRSAWIATAEDAIIAKLEWSAAVDSQRQLRDVAAMLDVGGESLDLGYVDGWLAELGLTEIWRRAATFRVTD